MDIKLHYLEKGQGEPLILLHGNGEDCSYFSTQIEYFSQKYRVIALDTRGHGQSSMGSAPFTLEQFAQDLGDFIDMLGIAQADILGFSDGGNIALLFALQHPQRIRKLILCGANLYPRGLQPWALVPILLGYRLASFSAGKSDVAKKRALLLGLMAKEPHIAPQSLQALQTPTLVIAGTHDLIRRAHTRLIAKSLPNAQLTLLSGGHSLAAQKPEEFNKAVENFLKTALS